jgi:hypothetical protein
MPTLPKANTLDYNPDSIISASKKIRVVQSEQMKDAEATNATLRPIKDDKTVKSMVRTFVDKIGEIGDTFNLAISQASRIADQDLTYQALKQEFGAGRARLARLYGGMDPDPDFVPPEPEDEPGSAPSKKPRGRPKKTTEPSTPKTPTIDTFFQRLVAEPKEPPRASKLSLEDVADRAEARGQVNSGARAEEFEDIVDNEDDLDEEAMIEEAEDVSEFTESVDDDESENYAREYSEKIQRQQIEIAPNQAIITSILRLTKLMREASSLLTSIKPNLRFVTPDDIEEMKVAYNVLIKKWDMLREPAGGGYNFFELISTQIDYSAEMLKVLNDERMRLMTAIITLVNSYNANEAVQPNFVPNKLIQPIRNALDTSDAPILPGQALRYIGAGRNFYGDVINDSRDIPTIWGKRINCPTKYLL